MSVEAYIAFEEKAGILVPGWVAWFFAPLHPPPGCGLGLVVFLMFTLHQAGVFTANWHSMIEKSM